MSSNDFSCSYSSVPTCLQPHRDKRTRPVMCTERATLFPMWDTCEEAKHAGENTFKHKTSSQPRGSFADPSSTVHGQLAAVNLIKLAAKGFFCEALHNDTEGRFLSLRPFDTYIESYFKDITMNHGTHEWAPVIKGNVIIRYISQFGTEKLLLWICLEASNVLGLYVVKLTSQQVKQTHHRT